MKLTFVEQKPEVGDVHTFIFDPEEPIEWEPGQYMHYVLQHPEADDRGTERWFTISSAPYEKQIHITTRLAEAKGSSFKTGLNKLKPGDTVEADGPKGKFILRGGDYKHIFIAGGIGVTPYHSMLKQFDHDGKMPHIELLYANNDQNLAFREFFEALDKKYYEFKLREFIGKRIEMSDVERFIKDESEIFYLSGPKAMVENYEHQLKAEGVAEDRIMTDYFPGY